jgi:hypothetical protein
MLRQTLAEGKSEEDIAQLTAEGSTTTLEEEEEGNDLTLILPSSLPCNRQMISYLVLCAMPPGLCCPIQDEPVLVSGRVSRFSGRGWAPQA